LADDRLGRNYYVARLSQLLDEFAEDVRPWSQVLADRYGSCFADEIASASRETYAGIVPQLPYIGGDDNHLTDELIRSARCLAFYQAMQARGKTAAQTGRVLYDAVETYGVRQSPPIPSSEILSPDDLSRRRRDRAERSQARRYPGDYVYEYVEGGGEGFDYGYDFLECAAQKLYHAQGADEFLPFYCFLDFPISRATGVGLVRAMTLADGHLKCNHRFKENRRLEQEWPPPFLG
jgi:hypothetical protein